MVKGHLCHHPAGVKDQFPHDRPLVEMGIESYLGVPLLGPAGNHLGHLAVFDEQPMPPEPNPSPDGAGEPSARIDGRAHPRPVDEAPIAYVHGTRHASSSANRPPRDPRRPARGSGRTVGLSLVPDTPDARGAEAFAPSAGHRHRRRRAGTAPQGRRPTRLGPVVVAGPTPAASPPAPCSSTSPTASSTEQEKARLEQQNQYLQEEIKSVHNFDEIVGRSPALLAVLDKVRRVAPTDATVLITGETGTGKELIARAVHAASKRKGPAAHQDQLRRPAGRPGRERLGRLRRRQPGGGAGGHILTVLQRTRWVIDGAGGAALPSGGIRTLFGVQRRVDGNLPPTTDIPGMRCQSLAPKRRSRYSRATVARLGDVPLVARSGPRRRRG